MDDAAPLGERELDVMALLWELGSGTVAEVRDRLSDPLAYTTVLTVLRNLETKGMVRHEEEGKAHRYFPVIHRKNASRRALSAVIAKLFRGSPELLLTQLVDDESLSAEEMQRLHAMLTRKLADQQHKTEREEP